MDDTTLDPARTRVIGPLAWRGGDQPGGLPIVPGYRIVRELGRGGMGVVYEAVQVELQRTVALKTVFARAAVDDLRRFRVEAEAVAQLRHPNIVHVYDVGEAHGVDGGPTPYFAMEFAPDGTLHDRLAGQPQPPRAAAQLVRLLARAISAAHDAGIVHRDLKPGNVLLTPAPADVAADDEASARFGTPKLTDFGLAQRLGDGPDPTETIRGTPAYMAPEQADRTSPGGPVTGAATDVYALGAILYECLTGRPPFEGFDAVDVLLRVRILEPLPPSYWRPSVPRDLETICLKCLAKEPGKRYTSAAALAGDLRRFLAGEAILARPVGRGEKAVKWARRHPAVAGLAVGLLAAVVGGLAGIVWQWGEAEAARKVAEANAQAASDSAKAADVARGEAVAAGEAARFQSARLAHDRGRGLAEGGDLAGGLHWMLEGLRLTPPGEAAFAAMLRRSVAGWAATSARLVHDLGHPDRVHSVAVQPGGSLVATACRDGVVRFFDLDTGASVGRDLAHAGRVFDVAFSPDGWTLAVACGDGVGAQRAPRAAYLWDVATRRRLHKPLPHDGEVVTVAFSPDGQTLATGARDSRARLWDVATGRLTRAIPHGQHVRAVAFSADGARLATATGTWWFQQRAEGAVRQFDAATGQPLGPPMPLAGQLAAVAYTPDGRTLVAGGTGRTVRQWDAATGQPLGTAIALPAEVEHFALRPDGQGVAVAGRDGIVRFFDVSTGAIVGPHVRHESGAGKVAYTADGRTLVSAGGIDRQVRVWALPATAAHGLAPPAEVPAPPPANRLRVEQAAFSPDGTRVVVAARAFHNLTTDAALAAAFDAATGRPVGPPVRHAKTVRHVAFSRDGARWASGGEDGYVRVIDTATGRPAGPPLAVGNFVSCVAFHPDGVTAAVGDYDGTVTQYDIATGRRRGPVMFQSDIVWCVAYSPDGTRLAAGVTADWSNRPCARLWDAATGRPLGEPMPHRDWVVNVEFSPDGRHLLTGSNDRVCRVWDAFTGQPAGQPILHAGERATERFSPDGRYVLTGSGGGQARRWHAPAGTPAGPPLAAFGRADAVAFDATGEWAAVGDDRGVTRVWSLATWQPVGPPLVQPGKVVAARFAADELVTVADTGAIRRWPLPRPREESPSALVRIAEGLTGTRFDAEALQPLDGAAWAERRPVVAAVADWPAWHRAGLAHADAGRNAAAALWHLDRLDPAGADWFAQAQRGRWLAALGDASAATRATSRAADLAPKADAAAWQRHRLATLLAEGDAAAAAAVADALLADAPDDWELHAERALVAIKQTARERVAAAFASAVAGADAPTLHAMAARREEAGDAAGAVALYALARHRGPTPRQLWGQELFLRTSAGDAGAATLAAELLRAVEAERHPDPRAALTLAWAACLRPAPPAELAAHHERVRAAAAQLPELYAPWLRPAAIEAGLLARLGRHADAVERYDALAAQLRQTLLPADYALYALALHRVGRTADAQAAFAKCTPTFPDSPGTNPATAVIRFLRAEVGPVLTPP